MLDALSRDVIGPVAKSVASASPVFSFFGNIIDDFLSLCDIMLDLSFCFARRSLMNSSLNGLS